MTSAANLAVLYIIPSPLGDNAPMEVLPLTVRQIMEQLTHFVVENEKDARRFIKRICPKKKQDELVLLPLNKFSDPMEIQNYLDPIQMGISMGLLSDAGCPGVADPGAVIVRMAHQKNIPVKPLVGPSSILLALMASGFNGQSFAFHGYLPIQSQERNRHIKLLEKRSSEWDQTQIFIETPYRNNQLLKDFIRSLHPHTRLAVACDLTLPSQWVGEAQVGQWKNIEVDLQKRPAIFLFYKELTI